MTMTLSRMVFWNGLILLITGARVEGFVVSEISRIPRSQLKPKAIKARSLLNSQTQFGSLITLEQTFSYK